MRFLRDNRDGPFFLYLAHMQVHVPRFVPKQFLDAPNNGAYEGAVEHIDWTLGRLMDELDRLGIADYTLIIFTSDLGKRIPEKPGIFWRGQKIILSLFMHHSNSTFTLHLTCWRAV